MNKTALLKQLEKLPGGAFAEVVESIGCNPAHLTEKAARTEKSIELYRFAENRGLLKELEKGIEAAQAKYPAANIAPPPDIFRLPSQHDPFFGREAEINWLNACLADDKINAALIHGGPGTGKTALLEQWIKAVEPARRRTHWIFAWSFYNQGQRDQTSSADAFFQAALPFFGCQQLPDKADHYAHQLALLLISRPAILLLDGLEPLQDGSRIRDRALDDLLRHVLGGPAHSCFILLSSRQNLEQYPASLRTRNLDRLGVEDGVKLLLAAGVSKKEPRQRLVDAVEKLQGHPLSLSLFGKLLARWYKGRLSDHARLMRYLEAAAPKPADPAHSEDPDNQQARHARQVLQYYDEDYWQQLELRPSGWRQKFRFNWRFERNRRETLQERLFLHLIALSDRPLSGAEALAVLRGVKDARDHFWPLVEPLQQALDKAKRRGELPPPGRSRDAAIIRLLLKVHAGLLQRLRQAGLLLPFQATREVAWDCHPLVRDYFADRFEQKHETAFRVGHRALFDFYRQQGEARTQGMDKPGLPDLEPFYRAIPHGCLAHAYHAALREVYYPHLVRMGEDGKPIFYSSQQLGAQARDLAVLGGFFPQGWAQGPTDKLDRKWQAFLLNEAAYLLMSQGRLAEARGPQRRGLEMDVEAQHWENAAIAAANLCDLHLALGELAAAEAVAQQGLDFARRLAGDDALARQMVHTADLAEIRQRQGEARAAGADFAEAENLERRRGNRWLTSSPGVWYGAWWLAQLSPGAAEQAERALLARVRQRAADGLEFAEKTSIRDIALYHLLLARCAALAGEVEAAALFEQAVEAIERADDMDYAPEFYLARAEFLAFASPAQTAQTQDADLERAETIIERGGMKCFAVDANLLRLRLGLTASAAERDTLLDYQRRAAELIEETGYHRQDGALWIASARLAQRYPDALDAAPESWLRRARDHIQQQNHRALLADWCAACEECGVNLDAPHTEIPEDKDPDEPKPQATEPPSPATGMSYSSTLQWDYRL